MPGVPAGVGISWAKSDKELGSHGAWSRRGFALVELLLALSVILAMGMLIWPGYSGTRAQAKQIMARHLESELNATYARWIALGGTISGNPNTSQVLAVLTSTPGTNVVVSDLGGTTPNVVQDGGTSNQVRLPQSVIDAMDLQTTIDSNAHVIRYADGQYDISFNANLGTFTITSAEPVVDATGSGGTSGCAAGDVAEEGDFSLAGMVFEDADNDGVQGANEVGIEQVTMTLSGTTTGGHALGQTTLTAADGSFVFTRLPTGTYKLLETQPEGYLPGKQKAGTLGGTLGSGSISDIPITSAAGAVYTFGNILGSSLSGIVFADANSDGVKQGAEAGLAHATLTLTGTNDLGEAVLVEVDSGSGGAFIFSNLRPGAYILNETVPSGYSAGTIGVGSLGGNVLSGGIAGITVGVGGAGTGYSFANIPASTPPNAPIGLTLTTVSPTEVYITWVDNSDDETGFIIERRPAGSGPWGEIGDVAANTTIFVDTTSDPEADFEYRVRAYNDAGESSNSNIITVSIPPLAGGGGGSGGSSYPSGVYLTAGTGFAGATAQPDPVGDSQLPGYDAKAIARWDVVPYQTFTGDFNVGVVAFHMNGIDHVSFSVNGGPWQEVREMSANPQTANSSDLGAQTAGIVEYWAKLKASDFSDGVVEVRAIAYPTTGVPRVLETLILNANSGGSLPALVRYVSPAGNDTSGDGSQAKPYASIMRAARAIQDAGGQGTADGGVVYLMEGDHTWASYTSASATRTAERWLTVAADPAAAPGAARLVGRGMNLDGLRTRLVRLKGLTIQPREQQSGLLVVTSKGDMEDYLWIDGCRFIGKGRSVDGGFVSGFTDVFVTGSTITSCRSGVGGSLVRDVRVSDIGGDAFTNVGLVVNSSVDGAGGTGTFHSDVLQFHNPAWCQNVIMYGVRAVNCLGQGFFAGANIAVKDVAFVGCDVDNQPAKNDARVWQFCGPTENMYVRDSRFVGGANWRVDLGFTAKSVVIERTVNGQGLPLRPQPANVDNVTYR